MLLGGDLQDVWLYIQSKRLDYNGMSCLWPCLLSFGICDMQSKDAYSQCLLVWWIWWKHIQCKILILVVSWCIVYMPSSLRFKGCLVPGTQKNPYKVGSIHVVSTRSFLLKSTRNTSKSPTWIFLNNWLIISRVLSMRKMLTSMSSSWSIGYKYQDHTAQITKMPSNNTRLQAPIYKNLYQVQTHFDFNFFFNIN